MSLILNIDTALTNAEISIANNCSVIDSLQSNTQNEHASFLHVGIKLLLERNNYTPASLDAVAVSEGPGSFTGIRVGMSAAKGLCFAANKPLIAINSLELLALNAIENYSSNSLENTFFCSMIDARRMEVYTAVYNNQLSQIMPPQPVILQEDSFKQLSFNKKIVFSGDGIIKWQKLAQQNSFFDFFDTKNIGKTFAVESFKKFEKQSFANLFYAEPQYLKHNYNLPKRS